MCLYFFPYLKKQFCAPLQVIHTKFNSFQCRSPLYGTGMLDSHSMRSLHVVGFINRESCGCQIHCSSLGCRIQPLICNKWKGMVLFLSKECFENDAYSRTSLKIINMAYRLKVDMSHNYTVFPFPQSMHCKAL